MFKKIDFSHIRLFLAMLLMLVFAYSAYLLGLFDLHIVLIALALGVVTYLVLGLFRRAKSAPDKGANENPLVDPGEDVIVEGKAWKIVGNKSLLGSLVLTRNSLIYHSDKQETTMIKLNEISSIELYHAAVIFRNGLQIMTHDRMFRFELSYPDDWRRIISLQIDHIL